MAKASSTSSNWNVDWVVALLTGAFIAACLVALVGSAPPQYLAGSAIATSTTAPITTRQSSTTSTTSPDTTTTSPSSASPSPSQIVVEVLNGNGVEHSAETVATALTAQGFQIKSTGEADSSDYRRNLIEYASGSLVAAQMVEQNVVGTSVLEVDSSLQPNTVLVTVGATNTAATG